MADDEVSAFLPPFANAENRELDKYIKHKQQLVEQCDNDIEEVRATTPTTRTVTTTPTTIQQQLWQQQQRQ